MSKAIKVDDQVYKDLDQLRSKGETFGQVIEGLIKTRTDIFGVINVLEGSVKYDDWKREQLQTLQESQLGRTG